MIRCMGKCVVVVVATACLAPLAIASGRLDSKFDTLEACVETQDTDQVVSALAAPDRLAALRDDALEHAEGSLRRIVGVPDDMAVREALEAESGPGRSTAEAFALLLALQVEGREAETPDLRERARALYLYHAASGLRDACPIDAEILTFIDKP